VIGAPFETWASEMTTQIKERIFLQEEALFGMIGEIKWTK